MSQLKINKALEKARRLTKKGNRSGAAKLYREILEMDPRHAIAANKLQSLSAERASLASSTKAAKPRDAELQSLFKLMQAGQYAQVETVARKLLSVYPGFIPLRSIAGASMLEQGKLVEAQQAFEQCVSLDPDNPENYKNLAIAYYRSGVLDKALQALNDSLRLAPDSHALLVQRGNLQLEMKQTEAALSDFQQAWQKNPGVFEAQFGLANALSDLKRYEEAIKAYDHCLQLSAGHSGARVNRANALKQMGQLDEAINELEALCESRPGEVGAACNLASIYINEGRYGEAAALSNQHSAAAQHGRVVIGTLAQALNYESDGTLEAENPYLILQKQLQDLPLPGCTDEVIADEQVKNLYQSINQACQDSQLPLPAIAETQLWRGKANYQGCDRHFVMFNQFNAIPKYCFDCYKVSIEPRNVVELIKLLLLFHHLDIPGDLDRKCMIETRSDIGGAYKGYIYCRHLEQGQAILKLVKAASIAHLSEGVTVSLKRGCSEYALSYPDFARDNDEGQSLLEYEESWQAHERYTDEHLVKHIYPPAVTTYNHRGINLLDALVIRNWLAYAAAIGDESYLELCNRDIKPMPLKSPRTFTSTISR